MHLEETPPEKAFGSCPALGEEKFLIGSRDSKGNTKKTQAAHDLGKLRPDGKRARSKPSLQIYKARDCPMTENSRWMRSSCPRGSLHDVPFMLKRFPWCPRGPLTPRCTSSAPLVSAESGELGSLLGPPPRRCGCHLPHGPLEASSTSTRPLPPAPSRGHPWQKGGSCCSLALARPRAPAGPLGAWGRPPGSRGGDPHGRRVGGSAQLAWLEGAGAVRRCPGGQDMTPPAARRGLPRVGGTGGTGCTRAQGAMVGGGC